MDRRFVWVSGAVLLVAGSVSVAAFRHPAPVAAPVVVAAPAEDLEMKAMEAKSAALEAATKRVNAQFDAKDKIEQAKVRYPMPKGRGLSLTRSPTPMT